MTAVQAIDRQWLRAHPLPAPDPDTDKNARGRVLVVGGARLVPGALRLTGESALRAGAGKLQLATVVAAAMPLGVLVPEAAMITLPADGQGEIDIAASHILDSAISKCDTLILGPGMSKGGGTVELVRRLIVQPRDGFSIVLDAAAIGASASLEKEIAAHGGRIVLTPHMGELSGLTGANVEEIKQDPPKFAMDMAQKLNAVIALKSSTTIVAAPAGQFLSLEGNCVGLATSGSGDVLAGLIGGFLARGANPIVAAGWGIWLHNAAGRLLTETMGAGFLARDLVEQAPRLLHAFAFDHALA